MSIIGKVVVITGASSGIGEATARLLAKKGAKVVLGARREDKLQKIVESIVNAGGEAMYLVTDVVKQEDNERLVQLAKKHFGKIDAIFLNAGIMPNSPLSAMQVTEWRQLVEVNINGVLNGIAAVLPTFISQKSGHIITTSSVAGLKSYPGGAVYGATKWAVRNLMEVLRMESAQEGTNIRTATLYPAAINTELLETISDTRTLTTMTQEYKKFGITPDRVASVVAFAIEQPDDVNINEFTIWPTTQS
ncbi:oxidoreductase [Listeria newyorkensis]|uniref:Oxidoreductase n=1 Tax=Listeria newyorkensis TaxID=1497681 RepID=A0ABX4XK94_9LIST|nr:MULTISPECIES: SDR family oxidoreductase [Listeria]KGL42434.1 oxidoreductase [Listeriaceae bacterium FSL A5-0209]KGL45558.1 oxidoreductase [Listeria newyorkensis]KMT62415.1 short chain dehydrogenase [Listeria newyorkensis]PNP89399.1 oxidoreductase [Listeria newyorkensis]RQW66634.1 SDR family NAD(P)-dependent oxidoreductase [Listeria sp. SHR_NRA_18]